MTGYVPTYRVILNNIRKSIASGSLKPGDRLPTLPELAEKYECSIGTARRAVEILLETEEIHGRQGVGTFVGPRPERHS
ncbi:winged helix-turn-helix domain-containing protein [Micromonospora sp. WMMD882]|uniref:GntR family transcriptional regulator n=1 Tax=Micromonospora sp. WMMD882 TaxID=3015151 RepID=UPI00248C1D0E|nr:winged helix-turn-helix domain-containing protein [Micromonospora sp. WMMD882]WBB82218.1 winged helix-turn-helix domain-containing protein [Micromonospora sp. WMMD882]